MLLPNINTANYSICQTSRPGGFALVITLSLMAFVLVLLLAMTTLVQVESQSSQISLEHVTATTNQFDANPNALADDGVEKTFWLAAYKTIQVGSESQPIETLRTWSTDISEVGRVDWLVSSRADLSDGRSIPTLSHYDRSPEARQ